jgi:acyl-CoA reductase-like NAD-dependent aldehyde dehydrogenase
MEQAVALSATGVFRNQGQARCANPDVRRNEYTTSRGPHSAKANEVAQPPLDPSPRGPLARASRERVLGYLKPARDEGAQAKAGGERGPQSRLLRETHDQAAPRTA